MINLFLKAKHWQMFLLTVGIPIALQVSLMLFIFSKLAHNQSPDPTMMLSYMRFLPLIIVVFMAFFFGWYWSVAIGLQEKIPQNTTLKVKKFKIFFFIPLVYFLLFTLFFTLLINGAYYPALISSGLIIAVMAVAVPLHFFSLFCLFYCLYFVAKTIKTVELQREVNFSEFIGEFFMIWFYFIGIWILQPKINRMVKQ